MCQNTIFDHQCNHAHPITSSMAHCPHSSEVQFSKMKVLPVLQPCPLTRSERLSIELFGVQNKSTNTVLTSSNVSAVKFIPRRDFESTFAFSFSFAFSSPSLGGTSQNPKKKVTKNTNAHNFQPTAPQTHTRYPHRTRGNLNKLHTKTHA